MVTNFPDTLAGRYRLEEPIAAGGMGSILRAHDEVLVRTVAVKLMRQSLAGDESALERFRREARIAASLSHVGIAQVFDFGQESDQPFIVMEFLEGEDLHTTISRDGPMDPIDAAAIATRVADALHYAHGAGTVHRDVKPGNIFRTSSGDVKLTDFGIARLDSQSTVTTSGSVMGTYHYLSPEQVNGERASPASDVYALGCVLFELITGRPPFEGENPLAVAMFHVSRDAPDVRELRPDVPAGIAQVVSRALSKNPSDRFESAAQMAAALREASGLRAAAPVPPGPTTEPVISAVIEETAILIPRAKQRPRLPKPVVAILGLALVLLVLLFAVLREPTNFDLAEFTGTQLEDARRQAEGAGLNVNVESRLSGEPEREVIGQIPVAGTRLRRGGTVTLIVSQGGVSVPNLIGKVLDAAREALGELGLKAIPQGAVEDPEAIVVEQTPISDTSVANGTAVTFILEGNQGEGQGEDEGNRGKQKGKDEN